MRLGQKQELFAGFIGPLIHEAEKQGFTVRIGEVLRFEQQARWNATHCRRCKKTKLAPPHKKGSRYFKHPFKAIGIVMSLHRQKLAIDIILCKDGKPIWDSDVYAPLHDYWEALHPLCAKRISWDGGHFAVGHGGRR